MHKNAKKDEWKTQSKISCHYTGSIVKIGHLDDAFLEVFLPQAGLVEGQSLQQKEKPEDVGHLLVQKRLKILTSVHTRTKMS